jgi:hypothetical protein
MSPTRTRLKFPSDVTRSNIEEDFARHSPLGGTEISTPAVSYGLLQGVLPASIPTRRHFSVLPGLALSIFFSTASIVGGTRGLIEQEPSVVLTRRPTVRRPISIAEARQIAIETIRAEAERYEAAAAREGVEFSELFGWKPE